MEGGRVVKLQSGTLEIGNAARDDEGEYKCRVANAAGEQFHTIRLNVTSEHSEVCTEYTTSCYMFVQQFIIVHFCHEYS